MDKNAKKYFIHEMTHKTRLARIMDRLLLCAVAYIIAYLWFRRQINNSFVATLLSAVTATLVLASYMLWFSIRLDRFSARHKAKLVKQATLEHLLLLPPTKVMDILLSSDDGLKSIHAVAVVDDGFIARFPDGGRVMYALLKKHPNEQVTATELLSVYQRSQAEGCTGLSLYSTSAYCADAQSLVKDGQITAKLYPPEKLIKLAEALDLLPDSSCLDEAVSKHIAHKKSRGTSSSMLKGGPRRYLLCAALLIAMSFFTIYKLYYWIVAGICLALAILSAMDAKKPEKQTI